ncbi:hypothetical protein BJX64DRAFT_266788 [Aspergillus heterothallicus]
MRSWLFFSFSFSPFRKGPCRTCVLVGSGSVNQREHLVEHPVPAVYVVSLMHLLPSGKYLVLGTPLGAAFTCHCVHYRLRGGRLSNDGSKLCTYAYKYQPVFTFCPLRNPSDRKELSL